MTDRTRQPDFGSRARRKRRRGAVLIVAIVCVAVATTVFLSIVKMAAADRRAMQTDAWRLQAAWLAESGLERAAWRLASDEAYSGETWTVAAKELNATDAGLVEIEIAAVPDKPDWRLVRVRADYPNHPQHRARQTKQVIVHVPAAEDAVEGEPSADVPGATENTSPVEEEP